MFKVPKFMSTRSSFLSFIRKKCGQTAASGKLQSTVRTSRKRIIGQPTHESHPHLIGKNEVIPLISVGELQDRRQKLIESILQFSVSKKPELTKHVLVIPSASKSYMSEKIPYVFRQNTDFLYLSGCQEPDTCLVISTTDSPSDHVSALFVRDRDSNSELWDGPRTSPEDAIRLFGVKAAYPMAELQTYLKRFAQSTKPTTLWYDFMNPVQESTQKIMKQYLNNALSKIWDSPKTHIHKLRLIKSPAEVELMKKSCEIISEAVINCIKESAPDISEQRLFAQVEYDCRIRGAELLAYPPVIAGGERATIIHYIHNNQLIHDGEMVLMDAGCEYHGYSSDITRTWPINGVFSEPQKRVYEAVLNVQQELIEALKMMPSLDKLFDIMCLSLGKKLQEIGLISGKNLNADAIMRGAYQFCPHHVSHYLGMDVHDTALIGRNMAVEPGMIVTVEPGVYISNTSKVPKEFMGLGIRIEDDILITENGPVVLTAKCPKSISDLENISSYQNSKV